MESHVEGLFLRTENRELKKKPTHTAVLMGRE
jgi:hypothetical protein